MKKITAIVLAATASLALCAPAFSGCSVGNVQFTYSEEGGSPHYIVSFVGISSPQGEYEIPAYYGENIPVTEIAEEGFAATNYKKITVPETVKKIGRMAFSYCTGLESVEFAQGIELDNISVGLFYGSMRLARVSLPDSVKEVEGYAFYGCSHLSEVNLGSIEQIGHRAFAECKSLEQITLPSTLQAIASLAFYKSGLKEIEIPDSVKDVVTEDGDGNETTTPGLGIGAFLNCTSLESAKIGSGIKRIPSGAFGNCPSLKEIYIPLSVTEVDGKDSASNVGHAFYGDTALTDVYYEGSQEQWNVIRINPDDIYYNGVQMNNKALINAEKHFNSVK